MSHKELKWYHLDHAAKVYPILISDRYTHVFRVSVTLSEAVDPKILLDAIIESKKRFPSFFVKLKRGLFWYYFEENLKLPVLLKESPLACQKIDERVNNNYQFTFYYYDKRISLEMNHVISDGEGAIQLLNAVVFRYLELKGLAVQADDSIIKVNTRINPEELEDGFEKYYKKTKANPPKVPKAYIYNRPTFKHFGSGVINSFVDANKLIALAKSENSSLTQYIVAILIYCMIQNGNKEKMLKRPVNICVPVNLRRIFPSKSLNNFSLYFHSSFQMKDQEVAFSEILDQVRIDFEREKDISNFQSKLNVVYSVQQKWWLKLIPLPLKYIAFKIGYEIFGRRPTTLTFSNIGPVTVPQSMEKHLESFSFFMGSGKKYAVAMNSFKGKISIVFSRAIIDTDLEKSFFRFLTEKGLEVEITSNYWEYYASRRTNRKTPSKTLKAKSRKTKKQTELA